MSPGTTDLKSQHFSRSWLRFIVSSEENKSSFMSWDTNLHRIHWAVIDVGRDLFCEKILFSNQCKNYAECLQALTQCLQGLWVIFVFTLGTVATKTQWHSAMPVILRKWPTLSFLIIQLVWKLYYDVHVAERLMCVRLHTTQFYSDMWR